MTTINTDPGFDTLAYVQRLEEAGVEGKQAQAHATRLRGRRLAARDSQSGLATKGDLANLEARLRGEMAALEARLQASFYRALLVQTAALAGIVIAIVKFL